MAHVWKESEVLSITKKYEYEIDNASSENDKKTLDLLQTLCYIK